jgi:hypothetical protein
MLVILSIDTDKLPSHTREEFEAWLKFEVGQIGELSLDNPLIDCGITGTVEEISF